MPDSPTPNLEAAAPEAADATAPRQPLDALATWIERSASTGERAALSRLSPGQPLRPHEVAALSRALIEAGLQPEHWQPATWQRWALIAHGIALAGHDRAGRLGAQLARAQVAESRVTKLLTARGDAFTQLLPRLLRLMANKAVRPNWRELGALVLHEASDAPTAQQALEDLRLRIAGAFFSAPELKAKAA